MEDRTKTGIPGLDELMEGGIPKGNTVLVSGLTGSGKTILGLQYLVNGATQYGEKGFYVTFEEPRKDIILQADRLGWDLEAMEKKGEILVKSYATENTNRLFQIFDELTRIVEELKPSRIVVDSISALLLHTGVATGIDLMSRFTEDTKGLTLPITPELVSRIAVMEAMNKLKSFGATTLVISELPENTDYLSRDTISEFLADGVILLKHISIGDSLNRNLEVRKMRRSDILGGPRSYSILPSGVSLE